MARKTLREAAIRVLEEAKSPLHFQEITRRALEQNLIQPGGATPEQSMGASLYMDIKRHNEASQFRQIGPGVFALTSFSAYQQTLPQADTQPQNKLRHLSIADYRSLRQINLDLPPLLVLIGANNTGKSNFLDVIELLNDAAQEHLSDGIEHRGGISTLLWRGGADRFDITLGLQNIGGIEAQEPIRYGVSIGRMLNYSVVRREQLSVDKTRYIQFTNGSGELFGLDTQKPDPIDVIDNELVIAQIRDLKTHPLPGVIRNYLADWRIYRSMDFDTKPQSKMRQAQLARSGTRLFSDGSNLTSVLYNLSSRREYRDAYDMVIQVLHHVYNDFEELSFPIEGGDGQLALRWKDRSFQNDFSANFLSDGTLRFLCLLVLLLAPNPPELLCIDEPEIGLHPELMGILAELMREAADRTQLIVVTHSPDLIRHLRAEEVAVVEKHQGATTINRLNADDLAGWLEDFTLDTIWSLGEIGGRP
jgi:predicted ATPase